MKIKFPKIIIIISLVSLLTSCGNGSLIKTNIIDKSNKHVHDYVDTDIVVDEPTCTNPGKLKIECECGDVSIREIEPLGHNLIQNHSDKYLEKKGNTYEKASYYYSCERCGIVSEDKTFEYGVRDYIYTNRLVDSSSTKENAKRTFYKRCYNKAVELLNNKDSDLSSNYRINTGCKLFSYSEAHSIINNMIADNPQFYFLDLNATVSYSVWSGTSKIASMSIGLYNGLRTSSSRQNHDASLEKTNKEVDELIRDTASDVEKALIIYAYVTHKVTYNVSYTSLVNGSTYGNGNCQTYSKWFKYLADRYNLGAISVYSSTHAYNAVYVDDKWYGLDACWGDDSIPTLGWFCCSKNKVVTTSDHGVTGAPLNETAISSNLMKLFKNDELEGVYYDLDSALRKVNDKTASYKIEFGINNIAGYKLTPSLLEQYNSTVTDCKFYSLSFSTCNNKKVSLKLADELKNNDSISYKNINIV